MNSLLAGLHVRLARRRGLVLALACLWMTACLLLIPRLRLNTDFTDMLPMSSPAIAGQVEALRHIRQADRLFLDVAVREPDPALLDQATGRVSDFLRGLPELEDVRDGVNEADTQPILEHIQSHLSELLVHPDFKELQAKLEPQAISNRLAWFKTMLGQPQGMALQQVASADPIGLSDPALKRLRALQAGLGEGKVVAGRIVSADGRHALVSALPSFPPSQTAASRALLDRLLPGLRAIESGFPPGAVRVAVTGAHRSALDNAMLIQRDSMAASVAASLAIAALLLAAHRMRWVSLLSLAPTLFGALGASFAFHLTGEPVSAVALGCGSMLIGVTVDYGICVLYRAGDAPPATRLDLGRAMAQLAPKLLFCALTTMAAFLVMLLSPVSGHRQLGAFGSIGVLLAVAFAILILPLCISPGKAASKKGLPLTFVLQRFFDWRERHARWIVPTLATLSVLCLIGIARLTFSGDLNRFNGMTSAARHDEDRVRAAWGQALALTTVVVRGNTAEEALRANGALFALLEKLQRDGSVVSFASVAPLVPALATRQANARVWGEFWTPQRVLAASNNLASAALPLGFRMQAFQPFLDRLASPTPVAAPDSLADLGQLGADFFDRRDGEFAVTTLVKADGDKGYARLRQAVLEQNPKALLLNRAALGNEIAKIARAGLPLFGAVVAACIALLLFLFLGRATLAAIALLPMAVGVFWTLGAMGLLGIPVDMANFIFVIFVIGVGGDYSLYLVTTELDSLRGAPQPLGSTGGAVTVCALTTLLGIGVLVFARHPAMFSIGVAALLGISLSLVATLMLVPLCMGLVRQRAAAQAEAVRSLAPLKPDRLPRHVARLYRWQDPFVTQFVAWKMRTDPVFRAIDQVVPPTGTVLDLGCGFGILANWLVLGSTRRLVEGVDSDPAKTQVARAVCGAGSRVRIHDRDVALWDYPPCDAVLMIDLLHYLPADLKRKVLAKTFDALRDGGCVVIRDAFAQPTCGHRLVAAFEKWAVRLGHNQTAHGLHFESAGRYETLLEEAGFKGVQTLAGAGLGSNGLMLAWKNGPARPPGAQTAIQAAS